ncbi:MAG: polysaccharide biosynthesis protein [Clostridia bacterium]|nr:polysaccharide biosynthesis protein [Clostridia bacterium]
MDREKKDGLMKGAAQIALGGFLAKVIGAVYRIPLTNILGGEGIGLYQLVYPFYCLLLTVSATGIPSAIAKLVAEKRAKGLSPYPLFKTAMRIFLLIGGTSTLLMIAFSPFLSAAQGERELWRGYVALSPSVFLVSAISVLRGYFQGHGEMFPTASSEVIEQLVKVGVGLSAAWLFRGQLLTAVTALLGAVSVSELVTLGYLFLRYRRRRASLKEEKWGGQVRAKQVLSLSLPVTLASLLLPLSGLLDSVILVRLLKGYAENAVALFGLFSGGAVTIVNLPVSVCYGVATASVPAVARAAALGRGVKKKIARSLGLTFLLSALAAVGLYFLADVAVRLVYRSLSESETQTLVRLVKLFSVSAVTLSCTQTLSASLTALGKPMRSAFSMTIAVAVKTALGIVLVREASVSVYGAAIAADVGYFVAALLNLFFVFFTARKRK